MGTCKCSVWIKPTTWPNANCGGALQWTWSEGHKTSTWRPLPPRKDCSTSFCNPNNCSNSKCHANGCRHARNLFCAQHGYHCPSRGNEKMCWADAKNCPGGLKTCLNTVGEKATYGELPPCGDIPKKPPTNTPPSGGKPSGPCECGCDIENPVLRSLSCVGYNFGRFVTDAAKTGGEQMPLMMMVAAGILLVLILKK